MSSNNVRELWTRSRQVESAHGLLNVLQTKPSSAPTLPGAMANSWSAIRNIPKRGNCWTSVTQLPKLICSQRSVHYEMTVRKERAKLILPNLIGFLRQLLEIFRYDLEKIPLGVMMVAARTAPAPAAVTGPSIE